MSPHPHDTEKFSRQMMSFRRRTDALQEGVNSADLLEIREELNTALEELEVAYEELWQQNNELEISTRELEWQQRRYQELFDAAPISYIVTDDNGIIKQANAAASQLLNIRPRFLTGKPLAVLIAGQNRPAFHAILSNIAARKVIHQPELQLQPRHSEVISVSVRVTAWFYAGQEAAAPAELRWAFYDLTEQKKIEAAERANIFAATFQHAAVGIAHLGLDGRWLRTNHKFETMIGYSAAELPQHAWSEITAPEDVPALNEALRDLFSGKIQQTTLEQRCLRQDGALIWVTTTLSAAPGSTGQPAYVIVIVEDITERKQIEAKEREQRALAEALQDTALSLTSTLDFEEVLERIFSNITQVIPHDAALLLLVEQETVSTAGVQGYAEHGFPQLEQALNNWSAPIARITLLHRMQKSGEHLLLPDWQNYDSFAGLAQIHAIRSLIGVPVYAQNELLGFLILHALTPNFFTPAHVPPLRVFATQAAAAIQNAHLYQQSRALAALEERQRLARDLHDSISQTLYSSTVIAESLPRQYPDAPPSLLSNLGQLYTLNRGVMAEMRLLLLELRPEQVLKSTLPEKINHLVTAVKGRKHIQFQVQFQDENLPLPPEVHLNLFRITQEAITNLTKHSRATQATITYVNTPAEVKIQVRDNGRGFDASHELGGGLGLANMQERVAAIGGELHVTSAPNQGTEVLVCWARETRV